MATSNTAVCTSRRETEEGERARARTPRGGVGGGVTYHDPSIEAVTTLVDSGLMDTPYTPFVWAPDSVMALATWLNSPSRFLLTSSTFT